MRNDDPLHYSSKTDLKFSNTNTTKTTEDKKSEKSKIGIEKDTRRKQYDPALLNLVRAQIEFYFSPQNLARDTYLRSLMVYNQYPTGAAPLMIISSFPKVRSLCAKDLPGNVAPPADAELVAKSLEESEVVAVSQDKAWIISLLATLPPYPMTHHMNHHTPHITPILQYDPSILTEMGAKGTNKPLAGGTLVEKTSKIQLGPSTKERTTVLLRDIPEDCDVEKVLAAFTTDTVKPKSARPDIGKTWYISFHSEADAVAAVFGSRDNKIDGQTIKARVKSEQNRSTEPSRTSSPINSVSEPPTITEPAHSVNHHPQAPILSLAAQANRSHQVTTPNYGHFQVRESVPFATQQQQIYQPHYGMPLHVMQNGHSSLPPMNYSFSPHMQSYVHHGNHLSYPVQPSPYFVNKPKEIPTNLVPQYPRDNFQSNEGRYRHGAEHNPQIGLHMTNADGTVQNGVRMNATGGLIDHSNMNILDRNSSQKLMSAKSNSMPNIRASSNQFDAAKASIRDSLQTKRNKNTPQNRNLKGDANNHSNRIVENGSKASSASNSGKQKGKNRKNRKNNNNSHNSDIGQSSSGTNSRRSSKEEIVMNKLNFPELKTGSNLKSDGRNKVSETLHGSDVSDSNTQTPHQLTGYAAALRQKRNIIPEEKMQSKSS